MQHNLASVVTHWQSISQTKRWPVSMC